MHNRNLHATDYSDSLCWLSILHGRKLASICFHSAVWEAGGSMQPINIKENENAST